MKQKNSARLIVGRVLVVAPLFGHFGGSRSFWPKCQHIYSKWPAKNCLRQQLETNCLLTFLSLPSMRMIFHPLCCHRILSWLGNCSRRTALKHTTLPGMCGKMLKCNCYCGCGPMCDVVHL